MKRANEITIKLQDRLTIADAYDRNLEWQEFVSDPRDITVDGRTLNSLDTAGLQLLLAMKNGVELRERRFSWQHASPALRNIAALLGLTAALGLDHE